MEDPGETPPEAEAACEAQPLAWGRAGWSALGVSALLALIVIGRALALEGEFYDAYEIRVEAQRLLEGSARDHAPAYRSALLILFSALCQSLGSGLAWVGPALLSAVSYAALIACSVSLARRLGARPWVAAAVGLLIAADHVTFVYGAHGMSDVPAAAACALVLVLALREDERTWRHALLTGLALGVAALLRPTAGVLGVAFLAGFRAPWTLPRLAVAGLAATGLYLFVSTAYFAAALGSLGAGLKAHGQVLSFMGEQIAENRIRIGGEHAGNVFGVNSVYLLSAFRSSPVLGLLALAGAAYAVRAGAGNARVVFAWGAAHLAVVLVLVGHYEARYFLLALPALGGLAALALEALAERIEDRPPWTAPALAGALAVCALGWSLPYEVSRLTDRAVRDSFPERIVAAAKTIAGESARYSWTTTHPFPVAPAVIRERHAYAGDHAFGIFHVGPAVVRYHLRRPVLFPVLRLPDGSMHPGLTRPEELRDYVRGGRFEDGSGFRPGDVLLVGVAAPSRSWDLRGKPAPPFGIGRVVLTAAGLDVELNWLAQGP